MYDKTHGLPPGLYDLLKTPRLVRRLHEQGLTNQAIWAELSSEELPYHLARLVAKELAAILAEVFEETSDDKWKEAIADKLKDAKIIEDLIPESKEFLQRIKMVGPQLDIDPPRPDTPLSVSALLTGSSRSPALRTQLQKELATADRADWLVSFIKYAGIVPLLDTLRTFTQTPLPNGQPKLRIATTSYMGATDIKAIEELLKLPNTEIRVSYDTKRTRLHAKAYLFHRETGFSSAYIGSANISKAALDEGLEWTAKISQYETEHLWKEAVATFESHWEDQTEFSPCHKTDLPDLRVALQNESGKAAGTNDIGFFDIRPYDFQKAILEDIANERAIGKNKHLVIAATGTGKTMVAAFDYKQFASRKTGQPRLLFVAHREEILRQARSAFRQVLRDGSFGDLVIGGNVLTQHDHLFCTVQSWKSREFSQFPPEHFDYVVLDEAHHASADSYQALVNHVKPQVLLGLTATPERSDGKDIRDDFGGAFTHEIRLTEAIDRALLCPFHYFGIPDLEGLDFSSLAWTRGGYNLKELGLRVEGNSQRAKWVIGQAERFLADMSQIRGLGFCVSVEHARFMAEFCNQNGLPSIALSGESSSEKRNQTQKDLENRKIRFIFTADLYNEGVDIPCVDTVLFLRPTESLTLFLQQLGRGLRLHDEKPHLTVLDFIAPQHRQFRFSKRFQALSSRPDIRIDKQLEKEMPFVPSGCVIHLERQAKEYVLRNIQEAISSLRGQRLMDELRILRREAKGQVSLENILDFLHLEDPDDLYKRGLPHQLLAEAAGETQDSQLILFSGNLERGMRNLNQMDDVHLLKNIKNILNNETSDETTKALFNSLLWNSKKPGDGKLDSVHHFICSRSGLKKDLLELVEWLLQRRPPIPATRFPQTGPLVLHASYTREQALLGLGMGSFESPRSLREGVLHVPHRCSDIFLVTINKSTEDFSPTTMYEDYAITDRLFHWQSQSTTSVVSKTGIRYIRHKENGYTPMLFIRDRNTLANGLTSPYIFAGPLKHYSHEGSKPITIVWELEHPLPAKVISWARRIN